MPTARAGQVAVLARRGAGSESSFKALQMQLQEVFEICGLRGAQERIQAPPQPLHGRLLPKLQNSLHLAYRDCVQHPVYCERAEVLRTELQPCACTTAGQQI
jgi:hypothetical protein